MWHQTYVAIRGRTCIVLVQYEHHRLKKQKKGILVATTSSVQEKKLGHQHFEFVRLGLWQLTNQREEDNHAPTSKRRDGTKYATDWKNADDRATLREMEREPSGQHENQLDRVSSERGGAQTARMCHDRGR